MWTWRPTSASRMARASCGDIPSSSEMSGANRLVRVGLDSRRDARKHALHRRGACTVELLDRVEHDIGGAGFRGRAQLLVRLVVAVDDEPLGRNTGGLGEPELAQCRDVGAQPFFRQEPHDHDVRERLRSVDDECLRSGLAVGARPRTDRPFAIDDEWRAELARELGGGCTADRELAFVNRRAVGKER